MAGLRYTRHRDVVIAKSCGCGSRVVQSGTPVQTMAGCHWTWRQYTDVWRWFGCKESAPLVAGTEWNSRVGLPTTLSRGHFYASTRFIEVSHFPLFLFGASRWTQFTSASVAYPLSCFILYFFILLTQV
ncbi:hypothetical protein BC826DRAFT_939722 [Russula brevipes]|nr:hypothetical protein BC826DRAFT_939722 [Russula brevipes]